MSGNLLNFQEHEEHLIMNKSNYNIKNKINSTHEIYCKFDFYEYFCVKGIVEVVPRTRHIYFYVSNSCVDF